MSDELIELCKKYELKLVDMNKVYWFLSNNQSDEAIRYLNPLVGYDWQVSKKIVELYNMSEQEQIEDGKQRIQNIIKQSFEIKNENQPKCPTCQSTNIKKISGVSKAGSVAMFGIFSQKVKHQFKCSNCGYEW
ncbi:MAG: hypothetical protein NC094_10300 [Bacteroidales bacterium]|nr:hypothetical protein [Lachnoclostridium sp.]MCM1384853.1 hypothetical protein [Lachnoclostridium sp.]MCM1465798.1 hypothetical protein [Bacteroidales bacterium]